MAFYISIFSSALIIFPLCSLNAEPNNLKLTVGILLPLSGGVAPMGEAFRKGLALYEQDHPSFKDHLEFIIEDHKYDGKTTVSGLHKLTGVDKVDLSVVWGNTPSSVAAPIAESLAKPLIALAFSPEAKGRKHVITFGPTIESLVSKIADQFSTWNLQNPAAVSIDIGDALKALDILKPLLDGKLKIKVIAAEDTDFKSLITLLRSQNIDGLVLFALPDQALTFIKQAALLKFKPKIVGGDVFAQKVFREEAAKLVTDLRFVYGSVRPEFRQLLIKNNNDDSYFFETACGYTLAKMLEQISQNKTGPNRDLLAELTKVSMDSLPIADIQYLHDEKFGRHFQLDGYVYSVTE